MDHRFVDTGTERIVIVFNKDETEAVLQALEDYKHEFSDSVHAKIVAAAERAKWYQKK
jgi:hypothetical protein